MLEKYVGMTPYNYCAGNPVRLSDPTGTELTEAAEKWAKKLEDMANEELSKKENKDMSKALDELKELRKSDQIYDVRTFKQKNGSGKTEYQGNVTYDIENDMFVIYIKEESNSSVGSFAHELKHAYQFETLRLSFRKEYDSKDGSVKVLPGMLYDITDEYEADYRGHTFGAFEDGGFCRDCYKKLEREEKHWNEKDINQIELFNAKYPQKDKYRNEIYRHKKTDK